MMGIKNEFVNISQSVVKDIKQQARAELIKEIEKNKTHINTPRFALYKGVFMIR